MKNKEVIISRDVVCVEEMFPMDSGTENIPTTEVVDMGNECEVGDETDGEPYDVDSDGDSSGNESEREDDSSDTDVDEESGEGVNAEVRAEGDNAEGRAEGGIAVVQAPGPEAAMALPDAAGGAEPGPGDEDVGDHGGECGEPLRRSQRESRPPSKCTSCVGCRVSRVIEEPNTVGEALSGGEA